MQNAALAETGLAMQYARFQIAPNELEAALRLMREHDFVGVNLTVPHKIAALALVDEVEERARKIGAINTIVFREGKSLGWNTDGPGFERAIREEFSVDLRDLRVLLLGAGGGAGRAIAWQCAAENCERLVLVNRTFEKAQALARELAAYFSGPRVLGPEARLEAIPWGDPSLRRQLGRTDLVVNATTLGLHQSDPSPLPHASARAAPDGLRSSSQEDPDAVARGRGRSRRAGRQRPNDALAPGRARLRALVRSPGTDRGDASRPPIQSRLRLGGVCDASASVPHGENDII